MRGLSQCAEGALQRPLVHVADAVDHDTLLAHRVDHVVREHVQRREAELPVADLEAMGILRDVAPTMFKLFAEPRTGIGGLPFEITLCISRVLSRRSRYLKAQAHFPKSFFRCSITSSIV